MACHLGFLDAWETRYGSACSDRRDSLFGIGGNCYSCEQQTPIYTELDTPGSLSQRAKSYLTSDPALVVLYKQLRDMTLQTLKGASMVSPRAEWEFIIQCARLYDRMGCDLLALDLGKTDLFTLAPT